ncbi:hypothetical protein [Longitalea luteola]|uniref:hypothetical protein n=1 Tax=Longitalea luteola TaxID=2812563 RepID=UPI001A961373|nr:hypothetical protein [Longitalea luteola]
MSFNCYYIRTDDFAAYGGGQGEVITRDNYESWFVMYVDDELSAADRQAVDYFVQQNPDLEEELVMLQQSVLRSDEHIVFDQKEMLFRHSAAQGFVNEANCEEFFVLYGDDELTNEEKDLVEQFVYKHPQYQAEFELIQQVKLVPDKTLSFPDKTYLYRSEEEDSKVVAIPWWRISAAAIAFLIIGSLAWYISIKNNGVEIAGREKETKPSGHVTTPLKGNLQQDTNSDATPNALNNNPVEVEKEVDPAAMANKRPEEHIAIPKPVVKKITERSNIQQPSYVKQESTQQPVKDPENIDIALKAKPVDVAVDNTDEQPVIKSTVIKRTISEPLAVNSLSEKAVEETDQSPTYVLNTSINKTPLRGFFRKVSRVVDKVTNPDDDGRGGIRIANLEIAVK